MVEAQMGKTFFEPGQHVRARSNDQQLVKGCRYEVRSVRTTSFGFMGTIATYEVVSPSGRTLSIRNAHLVLERM